MGLRRRRLGRRWRDGGGAAGRARHAALPARGRRGCARDRRPPPAARLEACHHRPWWRALRRLGIDPTGHGWDGWLRTERAFPFQALGDRAAVELVAQTSKAFIGSLAHPLASIAHWLRGAGDPN